MLMSFRFDDELKPESSSAFNTENTQNYLVDVHRV